MNWKVGDAVTVEYCGVLIDGTIDKVFVSGGVVYVVVKDDLGAPLTFTANCPNITKRRLQ